MACRAFGHDLAPVPEIGLGCANLVSEHCGSRETAAATITRAYERGVRLFDTAPMYGGGESEETLGEALGHLDDDAVFIATKLSGPPGDLDDFSYDSCMRGFEASLKRLQRERVHTLQIHGIPGWTDFRSDWQFWRRLFEPGMAHDALVKIRDEGGCRYIGVTSHMSLALAEAIERYDLDCVETASHYNLCNNIAPQRLMPVAEARGVSVIVANPLAGGYAVSPELFRNASVIPDFNVDAGEKLLREIMAETGHELNQLALLYLLADSRVTCLIPGPRTIEELEANLSVIDLPPLADEVVERLRTIGNTKVLLSRTRDGEHYYEAFELEEALAEKWV